VKDLLLNINPDPGQESRLAVAVSLAKSLGGHITCLQSLVPPISVGDPGAVPPDVVVVLENAAAEFQKDIEARLDEAEVQWTWIREFGDAAALAVSQSRLCDAVILSTAESYPSVGAVALHARTPVLAVPEGAQGFDVASPIVIAWNGSAPVANAMREALPLIVAAPSVHILTVDHDNEEFPAARAFEYLAHHSILSEMHWRHSDGKSLAQAITAFAQQLGAGAVVAGAYGHNRIREMLLGSATRELLRTSTIPLVLAH
jgi:nucleotide-binding universal stress UspA family protein